MRDAIEFHLGPHLLLAMESSHAPDRGDLINIASVTYKVIGRTYTVDHSADRHNRQMVCVINLKDISDMPA